MNDLLSPVWTATQRPELSPAQWESLLSQARRARLAPRLADRLHTRGWTDAVPERVRVHLANALRQARRQRDEVMWEVDRIGHALRDLPGPVVLLKGAAYVAADLPAGRARLFTDVDILVPRAQLRDAERALFAAGWIADEQIDPYDERYYRQWMHEVPPLRHVERHTTLDLHHTITPPTSRFAVDGALLLSRARALPAPSRLHVLDRCDLVLHGVVHLLQDGDFSGALRDLLDFDDLVRHFSVDPGFWPALAERALELRLQVPLMQVLAQSDRLLGTRAPAAQAARLAPFGAGPLRRGVMNGLLRIAFRPDHPDCDGPLTGTARWLLYIRSHGLRMPWYQILPHLARKAWMRNRDRWQTDADPTQRRRPPAL